LPAFCELNKMETNKTGGRFKVLRSKMILQKYRQGAPDLIDENGAKNRELEGGGSNFKGLAQLRPNFPGGGGTLAEKGRPKAYVCAPLACNWRLVLANPGAGTLAPPRPLVVLLGERKASGNSHRPRGPQKNSQLIQGVLEKGRAFAPREPGRGGVPKNNIDPMPGRVSPLALTHLSVPGVKTT